MCFPSAAPIPAAPRPPSVSSGSTSARVAEATRVNPNAMQTVLTTPLGDPKFGKSINRTVLTGVLT